MKSVAVLLGFMVIAGCGAANPDSSPPGANSEKGPPIPETNTQQTRESTIREALIGEWTNASCGQRQYLRRIDFQQDERFSASDEVAPCPKGSECVSTGVIRWQGRWHLDTGVIAIEIEPIPGEKAPDQPPADFLILNDEPLSIGARRDKLVCPFKQGK